MYRSVSCPNEVVSPGEDRVRGVGTAHRSSEARRGTVVSDGSGGYQ